MSDYIPDVLKSLKAVTTVDLDDPLTLIAIWVRPRCD